MKNKKIRNSRYMLWFSFSVISIIITVFFAMYTNSFYSKRAETALTREVDSLVSQTFIPLEKEMYDILKIAETISDDMKDPGVSEQEMEKELKLIYKLNKDKIKDITIFTKDGNLVTKVSNGTFNNLLDVTKEEWFLTAKNQTSIYFNTPIVQRIYLEEENYSWVIPISFSITRSINGEFVEHVLLLQLSYSYIVDMFKQDSALRYLCLMNEQNEIIYHPYAQIPSLDVTTEENLETIIHSGAVNVDGTRVLKIGGESRIVSIKTISDNGWKMIGIVGDRSKRAENIRENIFLIFIAVLLSGVFFIINIYISNKIYAPIIKLEKGIKKFEEGDMDVSIAIDGTYEVQNLGKIIQNMILVIKQLMIDIQNEHEAKRKSELDALQAQINPHFLYNTLDAVVWMIKNKREKEAVKMLISFTKLFRISLSNGKRIIPLKDELEYVNCYLMIQQKRYKDKFTYTIDITEEVENMSTIKLIVQPIVENSIYHGMEYMLGEGEIHIKAYLENNVVYIQIKDNGPGMPPERVNELARGNEISSAKHGSGISLRNVQERIKMQFTNAYGLSVESELDEGTTVLIRIPAIPYDEWEGEKR